MSRRLKRYLWVLICALTAGMLALILLVVMGGSRYVDIDPCDESYYRMSAPYFPESEDTPSHRAKDSSVA